MIRKSILKIGILLVVLLVAGLPLVYSHFWNGGNYPFVARNNDNNSTYPGKLLAYGDTNNSLCSDTDNGFKPGQSGTMSWYDPTDNNSYVYSDFCDTNNTLIELGCVKHFKINNVQYANYVTASRVDCNAAGFSSCNAALRRCV
jgi:hypothetical protein